MMYSGEQPIEVIPLRLGLTSRAYLVRQHGVALVDTGIPGREGAIVARMKESGVSPDDIRLILLTHGHADHAGSARALRDLSGAPVAVHREDAHMVRSGRQGALNPIGTAGYVLGAVYGRKGSAHFPPLEPDIILGDSFSLNEYGIRGEVIHTPGHTAGSVSLLLGNGDAIVGDLVFPTIPNGRPGLPFFADDPDEVRASIGKVLAFQCGTIYPGHGGPFSAAHLRRCFPGDHMKSPGQG